MKPIGILGFQGSVEEHSKTIERIGHKAIRVNTEADLNTIDGLILPGGESTTLLKLLKTSACYDALVKRVAEGLPVLATCAGIILLAKKVAYLEQTSMGLLGITIQRNGYGRQFESFCEEVKIEGFKETFRAVFIRAPLIESVDPGVSVLARDRNGHPVFVKDRNIWGLTFHPELTEDDRIHAKFIDNIT